MKKLCEGRESIHLYIQYGLYLVQAGLFKDAIRAYEKAASILEKYPESFPIRLKYELEVCLPLGKLYHDTKDYSKSFDILSRALRFSDAYP